MEESGTGIDIIAICRIYSADASQLLYVNPAYERIYGRKCESLYEKPDSWMDAVCPEDRQCVSDTFAKCHKQGHDMEYRIVRPDGGIRWIRDHIFPVPNENGEVQYIVGFSEDITEFKQMEEALRESEEQSNFLYEESPAACIVIGTDGTIKDANRTLLNDLGYSKDEIVGISAMEFIVPEQREEAAAQIENAFKGEHTPKMDISVYAKDGSLHTILFSPGQVILREKEEQPIGVLFTGIDVTERKRVEEELRDSENRYRALVENLKQCVLLKDANSRFVSANSSLCNLLGVAYEDIIGRSDYDFYPRELAEKYRTDDRRVIDNGETLELIEEHETKDGMRIWVEVVKTPVRDSQGNITGILVIFWDITDRKLAAEALRESEEKYRLVFENAREGISIYEELPDGSRKLIDCNPQYAEMSGYSREELMRIGDTLNIQQDHRTTEQETASIEKDRAGQPFSGVFSWRRPDKKENYIEYTAAPLYIDGRRFTIGIDHDITERKRAEAALAAEKEHLTVTLRSIGDGVISCDTKGKVALVNEVAGKLTGWTEEEAIGKPLEEVFHIINEDTRERCQDPVKRVLETGRIVGLGNKTVLIAKDGTERIIADSAAPILDRDSNVIGVVLVFRDITERKRVEAALVEERNLLRTLIDNVPDQIYFKDTESRFVLVNTSLARSWRTAPEDLIGKTDFDFYPQEAAQYYAYEQEIMRSGQPVVNREEFSTDPTGDKRWVLTTKVPLQDSNGKTIGLVGINRDITRRKQREEELRAGREMLSNILSASPGGISLVENGFIKWVNDAMIRLFGFEREEDYIGQNTRMLYASEEEYERVNQILHDNSERGETIQADAKFRRKDGSVFDGSLRARPAASPNHEKGVTITISDISWRKQAERALRESEEKYRLVVENASEGIAVLQDGVIKFVNPRAMELSGYSKDEITSKSFLEFIHPDDRQTAFERLKKRHRGDEIPPYPLRFIDKNGNVKWVEVNAVIVNWEERPATLNFFRDITETRRMEEELQKIARLESLGILAGGIAHDFNNIMTAILGNISLARLYGDPGKISERLEEAERASIQAKSLTQQLLTFSRGGAPIRKAASIQHLLKNTVSFALSGSNVKCEFTIPDDLWPAEIDESQVTQVIHNIVINADQAMPYGGKIKVGAKNVIIDAKYDLPIQPGAHIKISIEDQGVGIPKEYIERIFDPYFTTKRKGSGLGLATAYSIIKRHDGHITVESQIGVGTIFHVYLPASPGIVPVREKKSREEPIAGHGRILLMDDEEDVRDIAAEMLTSIGYKVVTSRDGAEATEIYKKAIESGTPFGLVVIDLTVPGGMGGRETIQRLLEIDPRVRAIVSSGYSNDPIMASFREYGFRGVIAKPYKVKEMSEVLHEVMSG